MAGRPSKITADQYAHLVAIRKARAEIPTNAQLAAQLGVSVSLVKRAIEKGIPSHEKSVAV